MKKVSKLQIGEVVYVIKDEELVNVKSDVTSNSTKIGQNTTKIGQNTTKIGVVETGIADINNRIDNVEGGIGVVGTYDEVTETLTLQ